MRTHLPLPRVSGTKTSRPDLDKMLDRLSRGDEVVVWELDKLGRNTRHLLELLDGFTERDIKFFFLGDGITANPDSELGGTLAKAMVNSPSSPRSRSWNAASPPDGSGSVWLSPPPTGTGQHNDKSAPIMRRSSLPTG